MNEQKTYPKINTTSLLFPVFALSGIGLMMIYSSSSIVALDKFGNSFHYVRNHIFTIFSSLMAMYFASKIKYTLFRNNFLILLILLCSLGLLCLVFIPGLGVSANGARRWIQLWPSTFQPSEVAKIGLILFLALYISKNSNRMESLIFGIVIPLTVMGLFQGVLLMQPDFGSAMTLGFITISMLYLGGIRKVYLIGFFLLMLPAVAMLLITEPYRMKRITAFLDPWQDPIGSGYQLIQSFIALGNGGTTGLGPGGSIQKLYFLPESHTDFIFSIIGEEYGLVGASFILLLFVWIVVHGVSIAMRKKDPFAYYLAMGITIMIGFQSLVNFCVTTGLMPTKGLPLPFVSYGGSAQLANMIAIGMLINIANTDEPKLKVEETPRAYMQKSRLECLSKIQGIKKQKQNHRRSWLRKLF